MKGEDRARRPPRKKNVLKKGIYIIPSMFTCGNASFGILSILASINGETEGHFIRAAWFLIGALACDIVDGRIARMTKTTSDFGMQLDSLSDLISFGMAPAMMMYMLVLKEMGKIGVAIAVLYVLCCTLRLARFNVLAQSGEVKKHFTGLPTPASAGVLISFVLSFKLLSPEGYALNAKTIPALQSLMPAFFKIMPVVIVILSFLMVSNVPYLSFKKVKMTKVRTIEFFAFLIVLIILIVVYPQNIIFLIFSIYAISGLVLYVPSIIIRMNSEAKEKKLEEDKKAEENDV